VAFAEPDPLTITDGGTPVDVSTASQDPFRSNCCPVADTVLANATVTVNRSDAAISKLNAIFFISFPFQNNQI
jgi:hypothetical protein